MRMTKAISTVFVVCLGLIAGILVGYLASAPAREALDPGDFLRHQQIVHIYYQPLMQVLMSAAILSGLASLVRLRGHIRSAEFVLTAIAFAGVMTVFILTISVNVPINNVMMTWNPLEPPANMREMWSPWESVHFVRTVVAVMAFIAAAVRIGMHRTALT